MLKVALHGVLSVFGLLASMVIYFLASEIDQIGYGHTYSQWVDAPLVQPDEINPQLNSETGDLPFTAIQETGTFNQIPTDRPHEVGISTFGVVVVTGILIVWFLHIVYVIIRFAFIER